MTGYPPSPWQLRGQLYASAFLVPARDLDVTLPPRWSVVRLGGKAVVAAIWVDYQPGGVLSYRELMTTVLIRSGARVLPSITHIWVDSPASRDGGRELWGIPKELAEFSFSGAGFTARGDAGPIARGMVGAARGLPVRLPVRFRVVQHHHGGALVTPVRATASVAFARGSFEADPSGPLAFLSGRRVISSVVLRDFVMRFGRDEDG